MKIVLIRLDKIGDLISTLPVDQIPELAGHDVSWVIAKGTEFIAENAIPARKFLALPLADPSAAFLLLTDFLKKEKPDLAVVFYGPAWASRALWSAGVPRRFGRRSQWHSYIFLNSGLRQSRSLSLKHEADYNLDLLRAALAPMTISSGSAPILSLSAAPARELFEKYELRSQGYDVVHPGMAGSALNWPTENYVALVKKLKTQRTVVLTGTRADEAYLGPIRDHFQEDPAVLCLQNQLNINQLLFILKSAHAVIAPSTGVIHLAASLDVPAIGIYSPVLAHHPRRWGPRGPKATYLVPASATEPMSSISVESVIQCLPS